MRFLFSMTALLGLTFSLVGCDGPKDRIPSPEERATMKAPPISGAGGKGGPGPAAGGADAKGNKAAEPQ